MLAAGRREAGASRFREWRPPPARQSWRAERPEAILQLGHARESHGQGRRMKTAELMGKRRDALAVTVGLSRRSRVGNGLARQRKRLIERRRGIAADDVLADSQPVRLQGR